MNNSQQQSGYGSGQGQNNQRIDLNNYMPDPNKRNELKRRLFDSGISNIPMPSVKRPIEENIAPKPYQAKMNPSKIQNTTELKKGIEQLNKNIINNLKESYEQAAVIEAKYKGEGTADYYKSQHIMVPPPQVGKAKTLMPKLTSGDQGPAIAGMSSTNRILLNKGPKPNQLPSLSEYGQSKINQLQGSQMDNMRLLQGPPAMTMAGFEGGYSLGQKNLELARSKYLVDKLTGKLGEEFRVKKGKLPPIDAVRDGLHSRGSLHSAASKRVEEQDDEEEKKDPSQQKWSDLDKYIELLLDSKSEEETVFVYLLPNPNGDPYDLIVCSYSDTREGIQPKDKYYTLSGKGLTLYENDMPVEFLSLGQWLIERDSYNHIKELDFFKKFKKWKFMRMWKKTIKHQNRMKAQNSLEEKLFFLQDHFSDHLFTHRKYMLEMQKQKFVDTCETGDTKKIDEFAESQQKKIGDIQDEIQKFSDKSRENIRDCISKVLSELRTRIVSEIALLEERKKNNPIQSSGSMAMKKQASNNVFEKLGFPDNMTYGHRSSLRKECSRFLRFAYLVDFLSLEALANIYTGSVKAMIERIRDLDEGVNMDEVMNADYDDSNQAAGAGVRGQEPLFFVSIKLNDEHEIPASEIKQEEIELYDQKKSAVDEFDLLAHLELEPEKAEDEGSDMEDEEAEEVAPDPIYKKTVPNIEKFWLRMEPDQEDYIEVLMKTFSSGLENIKSFERWGKHNDLAPYAEALEEWDDIVGDTWDEPDNVKLDPKTWIQEDPLYTDQKDMVAGIINSSFSKMNTFLGRFQPILEIFWRNKQFDQQILMDERLSNPIESIGNTIRLFSHYQKMFSSQIPSTAGIGLIQLDSKSARTKIQPTPENYIKEINKFVPVVIAQRNATYQKWLKERVRELSVNVTNVSEFVQQTNFYNKTSDEFQNYRDRVDMLGQTYNVLSDYQLKVKKEDQESFKDTMGIISNLANIIQNVESAQEGNKESFKKQLNQQIPVLDKQINDIFERAQDASFTSGKSDKFEMLKQLDEIEATFKSYNETAEKYNSWQITLETQPTVFEHLEDAREEITLRCLLWRSLNEWQEMTESWKNTPFSEVDEKDIKTKAEKYFKNVMRCEKSLPINDVTEKLKEMVVLFKESMPIVTAFRNDKMTDQHWGEIKGLINKDFDIELPEFTLNSLLLLDVNQYAEEITAISTQATQESNLKKQIDQIDDIWRKTAFNLALDEKTDVQILKDMEEVFTNLDETLAEINMILGSRFVKPLRELAEKWKKEILYMTDMVDEWLLVQKNWRYLANIFKAADIKVAMVEESKMFEGVDKFYKQLMVKTFKQSNCLKIARNFPQTLDNLKQNNATLDYVQKKLEDYMELKRAAFPRFYFLSSDELIDILANSNNLDIIQGHLKTCFDNIVKIDIGDDGQEILGMFSNEKERVGFKKTRKACTKGIELWLNDVQDEMVDTLRHLLNTANKQYPTVDRKNFVLENKGQIVATVAQIQWCSASEQAISDYNSNPFSLQEWLEINVQQLEQLIILIRGNLTDLQRRVIVALVTTDVHARDIIDEMNQDKVSSTNDFKWVKQLRYFWDDEEGEPGKGGDCIIKQVSARLKYGYEYMGANSRLVITPLTDKCWITISNALHIKLGANPAGPAGTGKTESTKDLAKAIAIQCIVFNCSDQVDYQMMGRLFSGLCQQGCWTCLDEFNRINIEVLSVIAQQLLSIRKGLLAEVTQFTFEEREIRLRSQFGCHVTMNPGYAGRTELPDNLKVMFRPVAMMIPDYGLIAEIMLFAEGFGNAKILSKKMVQLYKLSSEQLSQQDHYDFGLRAVKSVLVMAGSLKRANPDLVEDGVLIRAMRDANVPKFLQDDLPLFAAIIQDLFPTIAITENEYGNLQTTIEEMISTSNYQVWPPFVKKVIQLYETFNVRFGVMIVGPTGAGKTTCYETLEKTMIIMRERNDKSEVFQNVKKIVLNPKSISMGEMYGEVNEVSQEWKDGLASKYMRNAAKETDEDKTWIVFDGPVDAIWIENMNTVLDDNMTLCLANGQRIKLRSQMRMLFEVEDLAVASPATVSRCGMVYMTPEELGWQPYVKTWVNTYFEDMDCMTSDLKAHLQTTFDYVIQPGLDWIRAEGVEPIKTTDLQLVTSVCHFLEALIIPDKGFKAKTEEELKKLLDQLFCFSYAWGMGGALTQATKEKFDYVVREQFKVAGVPQSGTTFDYFFDLKKEKVFKPWHGKVGAFVYDKEQSYFDLMVPTVDTVKYSYCLETLLAKEHPMFFTGLTGVGKSVMIASSLGILKEQGKILPIFLNMSAQTTSARTQQSIEEPLEKKGRTAIGPPVNKKLVVFVDDVNMPAVETYGAQPPIELLRLFVDRKGLYERQDWNWKQVLDSTVIACAAPPSGGRANITMRFSRRFNMFCLPEATPGTLTTIFSSILKGFLSTGFGDKVKDKQEAAIKSTIEIYTRIQQELRATPAKFHYAFNLRDVSKVVQGLTMVKPMSIPNDEVFYKLWINECMRVFHDRLINEDDKDWFKSLIMELLNGNFRASPEKDDIFIHNRIMFGDLLKLDSPGQPYECITDKAKLLKILYGGLDDYNMSNQNKMNLVLFDDALEHLLRIARVLKQPRGHIMLIGVGGSGKQSLIKLCTAMRQMEYRSIEITKNFDTNAFKDVVKGYMMESGIGGTGISFVMTDTQIINESFIENLNNLLNTGEIPNLMAPEDHDAIQNGVRPIATQKKIVETTDNINSLFTARVRENLHICLCMSPVGDTLRIRCRQFPSLVNCCTLDWFSRWPEEALLFVSREFLKDLPDVDEEVREGLAQMCCNIHISVEETSTEFYDSLRRRVYTTPKSYLDLINLYTSVLEKKRAEYYANKSRLANGLNKLNDTNKNIAELKITLAEMKPVLEKKNLELADALVIVNADKEVANEKEKVVSAEAAIVNGKAEEAQAIADDAEADLKAAAPALKEAKVAVQNLDKASIVEIKNFAKPPAGVLFVMECIMVLQGNKKDWASVKGALSNVTQFMDSLLNYDVEKTSDRVWKTARDKYISKPEFEPAAVRQVSVAAAALATWASACSKYAIVTKRVAPKKAKYKEVMETLKGLQEDLQQKLDAVQVVKDKVAELEANCQKMQDEKEALEARLERDSNRMRRAEKLVVLLADEGVRWDQTVNSLQEEIIKLVGNVFLSCACISYFGAFTGEYREKMVSSWVAGCLEKEIPTSEDFSLVKVMGEPVIIRNWNIAGLPNDQVSSENGILCTQAERYSLCIDPQQQANKWIKNLEKDNKIALLKFGTQNFLREVTAAVRIGRPCMVEDVEETIDPAIDPILLKQQYKTEAGIMQIRIGESNIDYDEHFKFFMTTKMPNPHYIPEICIKVTLINFTVTFDGLRQQMLGDVVIAEKPEIEEKRDKIVLTMAADAKTLKDLENNILKLLSEATLEQILDEDKLIIILEDSKVTSGEINERMAQSKIVEEEIEVTRNLYLDVSIRGSILYFVISSLTGIDPMYQNSLAYVKGLFNTAIAQSDQKPTVEERLETLITNITRMIYTNVSRGLFEKDKLNYAFLITTSIARDAKKIDETVWNLLLRGPSVFSPEEKKAMLASPDSILIPPLQWDTLYSAELRSQGQFAEICEHVSENWTSEWKAWAVTEFPYSEKLPGDWDEKLSNFDKLILIKVFRPEMLQISFSEYVTREMGRFYVEAPSNSLDIIYEQLSTITPLIFVLTKGADPTSILLKFAKDKQFEDKLHPISLGQGQGPKAEALIKNSCVNGEWVMLQNCHLAETWMPTLEKIVLAFSENKETIHEDFRLFLTSMPADYFPVSVLQNSVKVTTEPPRGMKANLQRTYSTMSQQFLDECSKPELWRKLLFNLSFFHATIQERRKFGPLGWNILYEFNDSDLTTTFTMLHLFMDSQDEIPWDALIYVFGHINYGGRVTDDNDRICLITTLTKYCSVESLKDTYKFSPSGTYFAPADGPLSVYTNYIESLPLNDNPEIFGLHDNANINYQMQESNRIIDTILSIQPRLVGGVGGMTPDEIVCAKSKELLEILPETLEKKDGLKELFVANEIGIIPSLSTVLLQEMAKFNRLLKVMKRSLIDIDLAIKGFIVMSDTLDKMYLSMQNNQVPANWTKVAYPSLKPLSSWYQDLIKRCEFMRTWLTEGNPTSYWMPGMFFPQGFMTGVLQTHARQYKIAIDKLAFSFQYQEAEGVEDIDEKPEDGVYVYGMFMDGARWDRENCQITDQHPTVMFDTLPVIWFKPMEDYKQDPEQYHAPLYKTSVRAGVLSTTGQSTNFIVHVATPTDQNPQLWVTRAAALLCMLNT